MTVLINITLMASIVALAVCTPLASDEKKSSIDESGATISHIGPIPFDAGLLASLTKTMQSAGVIASAEPNSAQEKSIGVGRWGCRPCCYPCSGTMCCGVCCDFHK